MLLFIFSFYLQVYVLCIIIIYQSDVVNRKKCKQADNAVPLDYPVPWPSTGFFFCHYNIHIITAIHKENFSFHYFASKFHSSTIPILFNEARCIEINSNIIITLNDLKNFCCRGSSDGVYKNKSNIGVWGTVNVWWSD